MGVRWRRGVDRVVEGEEVLERQEGPRLEVKHDGGNLHRYVLVSLWVNDHFDAYLEVPNIDVLLEAELLLVVLVDELYLLRLFELVVVNGFVHVIEVMVDERLQVTAEEAALK